MPKFSKIYCYRWQGTQHNHLLTGEINALSINFAKANLKAQGIIINTIYKKRFHFLKINKKISPQDIVVFFRQLATLVSSGIPLLQSCEILQNSQEKIHLQTICQQIKNDIAAGNGFANSLKKHPRHFNDLSYHLLQAGEQSGTLEIMLNRVALYQEKTLQLKRTIKQALFYPAIISLVATLVTLILLVFVVPQFEELFNNTQGTLPTFTLAVIFISKFLRAYSWLSLFPILAGIAFAYYFKTTARIRHFFDHLYLQIPILKGFLQKIFLARFSRSLAILFNAGIPIIDALHISANTINNHDYLKAINILQIDVTSGRQLHLAMQNHPLFPILTSQMVKIGEESGTLDKMLEKIAELYESDISHLVTNLSHLLEPLIMIILGVLIGGLVIAMYLPIFKLGTVF